RIDSDDSQTVGELLDRSFAIPALVASGVEVPGEPGQMVGARLGTPGLMPHELADAFSLLTETEAHALRAIVTADEGANLALPDVRLRDQPFLAALALVGTQAEIRTLAPDLQR
ncbi:MAG: hypothetical protein ACYDEA_11850, partial [Candidatus Dormibacteria bacterium]